MRQLVILFFIFCSSLRGYTQNEIYKFDHITAIEGLSHSSAIVFHQDCLGQLWIGTRDGLNKYDGSKFTIYRNERDNLNSLSNSNILSLEEDSFGFIWVGTKIGLNRYDPRKDFFQNGFKQYSTNKSDTTIINNNVNAIKELSNKELLVGTNGGILIYNKSTNSFKSFIQNNQVLSIFETNNGDIFIGTTKGLIQYINENGENPQFKIIEGTEELIIQDIVQHPNGNLLLGTRSRSVLEYKIKTAVLNSYFNEIKLIGKNKNVRQLLFDNNNNLWIGTYNGLQIANENKNIETLFSNINDNISLNDNFIKALYKDKNGSIWVGTYHGGANFWDKSNINFTYITQKPGNFGLGSKVVSSIVNYENLIFFGTEGGGISILNKSNGKMEYINTQNTKELKGNNVKTLCLSRDRKLWIGTYGNGFAVYDLKTKSFDNSPLPINLNSLMKNLGVYKIEQHPDGDMLLGTLGKGLIKYNVSNKSFKVFDKHTKPNGLTNLNVRDLEVDSRNNIWVCTFNGLNVIDSNEVVKHYFYNKEAKKGYAMSTIFEDSKKNIWAGTEVHGLFKLADNGFLPIDINLNNSLLTGVRSILEDTNGHLWISSNNQGIFSYNSQEKGVAESFTMKDGLPSNQFINNSSLRIGDSNFFFGGSAGAVYFNPNDLVKNNYTPQVILTDLKINNKSISVNDDSQVLSNNLSYTHHINLAHNQGNFSISFSIPNFINSNNNRYTYRLKGLDKDWIETSDNSASYTIQKAGNYIFEVIGINSDGISNDVPTSLEIQVDPPLWLTWWAFTIYGLCLISAVYFILNILKSKSKLKHQLEFEHKEALQVKEMNKAKLDFFTNISHEFRTPLTLILGPLQQILENYRGSSSIYKKLKIIDSSANHLLKLINRLMDFRKLEDDLVRLEAAEGNIVEFLREIYLSFSEFAKDGNYDYSFQTPKEEILVYYDRYKLERVFYNLLSNAFRYTAKNGKIVMRIIEEDGKVRINVEDSGVGIAKEYREKIFERFFELSLNRKPDNYYKGTGIGLSIVKNIVDLHKGKITLQGNENKIGSIFTVELLLNKNHLSDDEIFDDFKYSDDLSQYVSQMDQDQMILEDDVFTRIVLDEKPTILLVEDNKPLRTFMRNLLLKDYNILEAENGKAGFKIALGEHVDIIVSDIVMPLMTGIELCALIKGDIRTSHIPVILLTARSSLIFRLEGLESGADDYISKPFNLIEFRLRIKNLLNSLLRLRQRLNSSDKHEGEDVLPSSLDEKLYKKALQIVEKNIGNEQFDISYFCEELGVSRTVLFNKIKVWTDFSPKDFIQHLRLTKAAQLLEQGKLNISEISYTVGFKNSNYFGKSFRKKFGKSPTEYAKTFMDY